jgi:hypothetical protein
MKKKRKKHGKKRGDAHKWFWGSILKKKNILSNWVQERTEKTYCFGFKNRRKCLQIKLINGVAKNLSD